MDQAVYTCRDSVSGGAPVWEVGRSGQVTRTGRAVLLSGGVKLKESMERTQEDRQKLTNYLQVRAFGFTVLRHKPRFLL